MLYGNGIETDFIGFSNTLIGPVSGRYEDYVVTTYKSDNPEVKNNTQYTKTSYIDVYRDGTLISLPIQELQIGDITYYRHEYVEKITLTQECAAFDYFKPYTITRNSQSISISGNELKTGDIWLSNEITAVDDPLIKAPTLNIMFSNSGIHVPNCAADAILLSRQVKWNNESDKERYLNTAGIAWPAYNWDSVYTNNTRLGIYDFTGTWAGYSPHDALYQCLNWWEFANNPPDIEHNGASAHIRLISSDYGSYSKIKFSTRIMPADSIKIGNPGVEYNYLSLRTNPNDFIITQNPIGMPDYAGGMMLFSANEPFNENKLVGIGIKGIRFFELNNRKDNAFKLYRFTDKDGYFKYLGNNIYYFNDSKMIGVKGHDWNCGPYAYAFSGPNFIVAEISAGIYTNASSARQDTININANQYINNPQPLSHIVYITPDKEPHATSGKPLGFFDMGIVSADWYLYHMKQWNDEPNDTSYFSCVTFAPGIPLTTNSVYPTFRIKNTATELEFGRSMSAIGSIIKYGSNEHLEKLIKINGDWHYCTNVSVFGWPVTTKLFYNASALTTIPSSWEGLESVTSVGLQDFFAGCKSLTAVPSSFDHFGGLSAYPNAASAFYNCESLQTGLKNWKGFEGATTLQQAFYNCYLMPEIPSSWEGLNGNSVYLESTFKNCRSLKVIPSSFKDAHITYIGNAFENCSSLETMNTSWEGLEDCGYANYAFHNCTSITKIPSKWTGLCTNYESPSFDYMFMNCTSLTGIDSWTDFNGESSQVAMFMNCTSLRSLPTTWQGFNANNAVSAFANCTSLTDIPKSWNGKATSPDYASLFEGCINLTGIPTTQEAWAAFGNGNIYRMFANCTSLTMDPKPIMDGLNRPGAGMQMFKGCVNMANTATYITQSAYSSYFI